MAEVAAAMAMDVSSPDATKRTSALAPSTSPDGTARRLSMSSSAAGENDDENESGNGDELPSVHDLLQAVAQLQGMVREIGPNDGDAVALFDDDESPFTIYRSPNRGPRYYVDPRSTLKHHTSAPNLAHGIYDPRKRGTSVVSALSPQKDDPFRRTGGYASGLITPPPKRRDISRSSGQSSVPRPTTRVAALTRENISLLPTPQDYARRRNTAGSISGASQQSRTSVRTDGGAVFSRLYQADYHKNREQKLRAIRDRQENLNFNFSTSKPSNAQRTSISSRDSVGSSSIGSMQSAKTDITSISSRLYDPDYVRKRNAKLNRLREERELRNCTFAPAINTASPATLNAAGGNGAPTPNRRASSIHLNLKS